MSTLAIFLQAVEVATNEAVKTTVQDENLLQITMKGGWVLIPISIMLVLATYLIIAKSFQIKAAKLTDDNFANKVTDLLADGKIESALNICQATDKPASKVLAQGIKTLGHPIKDIQDAMEGEARQQMDKLNNNMHLLSIISSIAPMFGFLGTIFGVIKIFYSISLTDNISIGIISEGLYQKMISSAAGLMVGIIAYAAYHLLNASIDKVTSDIERNGNKLVSSLREN